jgi:hypothetical protein
MKIKLIKERKQLGTVYHFTTLKGITNILLTNEFQGSEANVDKFDKDFIAQGRDREEKFLKNKGIYSVYYFSTTRNKFLYKKNPSIKGSYVRLILDGDKYPIKPYYYYHDEMIDEPNPKYDQDESEERILLGTKKTIPNATSYIKEIQIILDVIQDNNELLKLVEILIKKYPDLIKLYYKEKEITLKDYKINILPTIEPYYNVDENDGSFKYRGGPILHEMAKSDLNGVEKYADKELNPLDIEFSKHFFDRLNDPRNNKEISIAELIGFFKRLSRNKNKFIEFLKKYKELVVIDSNTNINIPFVNQVNQVIAKTVMRKQDFITSNPTITLESIIPYNLSFKTNLLLEAFTPQKAPLMKKFVEYACNELNIDEPKIHIINSPTYSQEYKSFGGYIPSEEKILVVVHNRNMADILRTLAHELVHHMQNQNGDELDGNDGSNTENEAHARAGVIMRKFGRENPEIFE